MIRIEYLLGMKLIPLKEIDDANRGIVKMPDGRRIQFKVVTSKKP